MPSYGLTVPDWSLRRNPRRSRSIVPGWKSIGPAPGCILPAGFGGLRPPNPAGRMNPGTGPKDFRPGTIDRLLRGFLQSDQSGTVNLWGVKVQVTLNAQTNKSTSRGPTPQNECPFGVRGVPAASPREPAEHHFGRLEFQELNMKVRLESEDPRPQGQGRKRSAIWDAPGPDNLYHRRIDPRAGRKNGREGRSDKCRSSGRELPH
jgi:hypothetical protein